MAIGLGMTNRTAARRGAHVDDLVKPDELAPAVRRRPSRSAGPPVIGYVVVLEDATELPSASLPLKAAALRAGCRLLEVVHDRAGRQRALDRPGLTYALKRIGAGEASGLVVGDIMRATRSVVDLAALVRWFVDTQATLIALDLGIDTSTSAGRHAAAVLCQLGEWERERIMRGTRDGLHVAKERGRSLGPPSVKDRPELSDRIVGLRRDGMTLQAIADLLNAEDVPTARGGARWRPSSVQVALGYRRPTRNGTTVGDKERSRGQRSPS